MAQCDSCYMEIGGYAALETPQDAVKAWNHAWEGKKG